MGELYYLKPGKGLVHYSKMTCKDCMYNLAKQNQCPVCPFYYDVVSQGKRGCEHFNIDMAFFEGGD